MAIPEEETCGVLITKRDKRKRGKEDRKKVI